MTIAHDQWLLCRHRTIHTLSLQPLDLSEPLFTGMEEDGGRWGLAYPCQAESKRISRKGGEGEPIPATVVHGYLSPSPVLDSSNFEIADDTNVRDIFGIS